jgi:cytochrome c oxidase cbb3-type subunit III
MPTKAEKDSVTGTETTGHEWDGIKELNTPLPKWWVYVFYATVAYSLVYWVLYPSIPGISGYVGGVLGTNNRLALDEKLAAAEARQAVYLDRIAELDTAEIAGDPQLLSFALAGGRSAFADNCAPCHGLGGAGQHGYPTLADDVWLWGGTLDDIETTVRYGIRSGHDEARFSEMPAFGADEILSEDEIAAVAEYVLSLSGRAEDQAVAAAGAEIFADNCAACHGEEGEGDPTQGAPRLNDQIWLYGGERADIMAQVRKPQQGIMPAWVDRLDPATIKMLTVYVHSLGGGQP